MSTKKLTSHTFHVLGMHCHACTVLIEEKLSKVLGVTKVKAFLETNTVSVTGNFDENTPEQIAESLSQVLKPHGYELSVEKKNQSVNWQEFKIAMPIAAGFVLLFVMLQKLGIVNLVSTSHVSYGTAFIIGLIASVSTCMAVVGGLVLSMSANYAKEGNKVRPQILFHVGRLIAFLVLGGVIGAVGSVFQIGMLGTFILGIAVSIVLLVLGINLLDVFPWVDKLQPRFPEFLGNRVHGLKQLEHTLAPVLVGVATFFLPCGFTQSMQIYTLSTGSFWVGAITMFVFALGTLPVLALLSFSSLGVHKKAQSGVFFKSAGLIVIFFGLFTLMSSLVAYGLIQPIFNF